MATETVPMDDKELFSATMADEAPAETPVVETPTETEQPRDEQGRFASKTVEAPQADAAPTQQQPEGQPEQKPDEAQVPSWRLREVREAREAAERRAEEAGRNAYALQQQMAEMQRQLAELRAPKQEPVDFFADPNAAFKQQISPIQEQFSQLQAEVRMANSKALAIARHGAPAVDEMEKAVAEAMRNNDPEMRTLGPQIANSSDPVGTAMQWYSNRKVLNETGGDIGKFKDKILADALKDQTFLAKALDAARGTAQANSGDRPNIQLPPSVSRIPGSGVTAAELDTGDMSNEALFRHAVGSRR